MRLNVSPFKRDADSLWKTFRGHDTELKKLIVAHRSSGRTVKAFGSFPYLHLNSRDQEVVDCKLYRTRLILLQINAFACEFMRAQRRSQALSQERRL